MECDSGVVTDELLGKVVNKISNRKNSNKNSKMTFAMKTVGGESLCDFHSFLKKKLGQIFLLTVFPLLDHRFFFFSYSLGTH